VFNSKAARDPPKFFCMADDPENVRTVLVLEGPEGSWDELVTRVGGLGFNPLRCETIDDAERALEAADVPIGCALPSSPTNDSSGRSRPCANAVASTSTSPP
jgi:hypothetical protein